MPLYPYLQTRYKQGCDIVRQRIGQEGWQQVWEAGLALSVEQMIEAILEA